MYTIYYIYNHKYKYTYDTYEPALDQSFFYAQFSHRLSFFPLGVDFHDLTRKSHRKSSNEPMNKIPGPGYSN